MRGVSRDLSAQAVGEYLLKHGAPSDTVVIAEKDGIILDNAFERVGLPRAGFQHYSRFRAVNQVLKLALALLWEPVSPRLMLQFLIHPVGPLPLHARSTLAEAVAQQPGVGGQAWQLALRKIAVRQKKRFGDTSPAVRGLAADIAAWLDCERYSPLDGAPIEALIARSQRCASWLVARLHVLTAYGDQTLFSSALGQAEALIESLARLKEQGHERLVRIELERLLDEVTGGSHDPDTFAEAAHARATTHPSLITAPWHTVIWWDLSPQAHEVSYPWSKAELAELAGSGVRLASMETRLKQRTRQWLRPIVNATARLMLVVHDTEAGYHPLWNQLTSLFDGLNEVRLDQTLFDGTKPGIPVLLLGTETVTPKPLPRPKRWWDLPQDCVLQPSETESYSSLDKVIYYPHQWVLTYPARLQAGRAADLAEGNMLAGNLAHRLFQDFFDEHADWYALDESAITAWLAEALQRLIRQEGAVLFEPGRGVDRERVAAVIHDSFRRLLAHLKSADVEAVAAEYPALAPYKNIQLGGAIDLLLRTRRGREVVLDVKWGGEDRRGEALQDNRHLQLAIYAYLRKAASRDSRWPPQAFFIVSTGNLLAQDADVFPDAVVFPPDSDEGIEGLWRRASHSFDWRWTQLAKGQIEVNAEGHRTPLALRGARGGAGDQCGAGFLRRLPVADRLGGRPVSGKFDHVTFISAGAGSGKTYRLTEELQEALVSQSVNPAGVMGTTFTVKAASELKDRVRERLIKNGYPQLAEQMAQALIGTVHSVCERLLKRFAFELGLSPALNVVSIEDTKSFFNEALDEVMSTEQVHAMNGVAARLSIDNWQADVKAIADAARGNDLDPALLPDMARENADDLLAFFPDPTTATIVTIATTTRRC